MAKTNKVGATFLDRNEQQIEFTTRQAGRLGGLTTLSRYGIDHYRKIGRMGQASFTAKFSVTQRSCWGKKGGRPKKYHYRDMGERRKTDERRHGSPLGRPTSSLPTPSIISHSRKEKWI